MKKSLDNIKKQDKISYYLIYVGMYIFVFSTLPYIFLRATSSDVITFHGPTYVFFLFEFGLLSLSITFVISYFRLKRKR